MGRLGEKDRGEHSIAFNVNELVTTSIIIVDQHLRRHSSLESLCEIEINVNTTKLEYFTNIQQKPDKFSHEDFIGMSL